MIGNIRQPSFVWCDLSLLKTLARKEYISGIAEVIKYGAIWDREFLDYLKENMEGLLELDMEVLKHVVGRSARIKVEVVQKDEKESDLRRILNFGHTIGHAIEREKKALHGQAVSMGMLMAARLSQIQGILGESEVELLRDLLVSAGLPVQMELDPEVIYQNIRKDKKKSGEHIHFVLLDGLGQALIKPFNLSELKSMIHDLC
jgi:3-dehydroquinate synthase